MQNVDISIVLDRSGSMQPVSEATIEGFNTFLKSQKEANPDGIISLIQFDDIIETVYADVSIKDANYLSEEIYKPRGATALFDAIGRTIASKVQGIKKYKKKHRPKVIIVVITDGYENSSTYYTQDKIFSMIKNKREHATDNWEFMFLGADQDAIAEANKLGINMRTTIKYAKNDDGIRSAYGSLAETVTTFSQGGTLEFSEEDREKQNVD